MKYKEIEKLLLPKLEEISETIKEEADKKYSKGWWGRINTIIISELKVILCDLKKNPTLKYEEAMRYYFPKEEKEIGKNALEKYNTIIKLQNLICVKTGVPFIYDKFTVLKILQLTLTSYNAILNDCYANNLGLDETTKNIFIDIETMLINDRNTNAENNNVNAKAIDNSNRYSKDFGGYGVVYEKGNNEPIDKKLVISVEETNNKLDQRYNFTAIAEKTDTKKGKE